MQCQPIQRVYLRQQRTGVAEMKQKCKSVLAGLTSGLRRYFLAGILAILPLAVTILVLKWLFELIDGILAPAVETGLGRSIPGIGFVAFILLILLAGVVASNVLGRRIIQRGEKLLADVPMVRELYKTFKQVLESVMMPHKGGFKEVVLIEFPRPGMKTIGFVTNRLKDASGSDLVSVYIPTTPNPTSGYLEILPEGDVVKLAMSVEDAIKMIVSGGMVSPPTLAVSQ